MSEYPEHRNWSRTFPKEVEIMFWLNKPASEYSVKSYRLATALSNDVYLQETLIMHIANYHIEHTKLNFCRDRSKNVITRFNGNTCFARPSRSQHLVFKPSVEVI